MTEQYCASWDGEIYRGQCDSREDAIAHLRANYGDPSDEPAKIWTARCVPITADHFCVTADDIVEQLVCQAEDLSHYECVDGWMAGGPDKEFANDIDRAVRAFIERHPPRFWMVADPIEHDLA